jgi:hypothetical protein
MMSKKDYIAVSNILSNYREVIDSEEYFQMCVEFAKYMSKDNTRFEISVFLKACHAKDSMFA